MLAAGALLLLAAAPARTQPSGQQTAPAAPALTNLPKGVEAAILKAEVALDRAGFSPGVIDGRNGDNFRKALAAFQEQNGLAASGKLDQPTASKLDALSQEPALTDYTITQADTQGPFAKTIPHKFEDMAKLPQLAYTSPREALAERFHMAAGLLQALNRKAEFDAAGTRTASPMSPPRRRARQPVRRRPIRAMRRRRSIASRSTSTSASCARSTRTDISSRSIRPRSAAPRSRHRPESSSMSKWRSRMRVEQVAQNGE